MPIYSAKELDALGLASYGKDVRISRKASLHNPSQIAIGAHVRIDDFCVLSAGKGASRSATTSMSRFSARSLAPGK